jgi:hypothetical protein
METDENKAQNTSQGDSGTNKATKRVNTDKSNESGTQASPELSEELRKVAFKYDESDYRHWIPLLIADKIGKIEEILEDLAPDNNILDSIVEFGRTTDWKADKKDIIKKAASTIGAASFEAVTSAISRKIKERGEEKSENKSQKKS